MFQAVKRLSTSKVSIQATETENFKVFIKYLYLKPSFEKYLTKSLLHKGFLLKARIVETFETCPDNKFHCLNKQCINQQGK